NYTRYLRGDGVDELLGMQSQPTGNKDSTPTHSWFLTDRQGSVLRVVSAGGGVTYNLMDYSGGGAKQVGESTVHDYHGYTGRETDPATGLRNNRARWYNPRTGQWLTKDPLGFAGGDTNLYRYVNNSWPNGSDPSGTTTLGMGTLFGTAIGFTAGFFY